MRKWQWDNSVSKITAYELLKACSCPTRAYKVSTRVPRASRSHTNASLAVLDLATPSNGPAHSRTSASESAASLTDGSSRQQVPGRVDSDSDEFQVNLGSPHVMVSPLEIAAPLEIAEPLAKAEHVRVGVVELEGCGCGSNSAFEG